MQKIPVYQPKNKVRIVTAASLFDGHDASINIMRRIIQATGVEVIHLGHDRSVEEVVNTAIQEDANAIALTSYQGGHNEYFKYILTMFSPVIRLMLLEFRIGIRKRIIRRMFTILIIIIAMTTNRTTHNHTHNTLAIRVIL